MHSIWAGPAGPVPGPKRRRYKNSCRSAESTPGKFLRIIGGDAELKAGAGTRLLALSKGHERTAEAVERKIAASKNGEEDSAAD